MLIIILLMIGAIAGQGVIVCQDLVLIPSSGKGAFKSIPVLQIGSPDLQNISMIHCTDGLEGYHGMQRNQTDPKPEFRKYLCIYYVTMCKNQPLRLKSKLLSNILFVTLWHPESHAGSSPVWIDVDHQKSSLGKIWKQCWKNTKTCDIMASHSSSVFGQRSPEAPPPLFPISVHNGNVEILCRWQH